MATSLKGETAIWGTSSMSYATSGYIQSGTLTKTAQTGVLEDEDGAKTGEALYDELYTMSATVTCRSSASGTGSAEDIPGVGDIISVNGKSLIVDTVTENWTAKGYKNFTVSAHGGVNMNLRGA